MKTKVHKPKSGDQTDVHCHGDKESPKNTQHAESERERKRARERAVCSWMNGAVLGTSGEELEDVSLH